jgi:FMN phosphatase YigB (HAD superfamily)
MKYNRKIKAVLFDFDMTLVDSSYAIHHCTTPARKPSRF